MSGGNGLTLYGPLDALARDWKRMREHLVLLARSTHEPDGSVVSFHQREEAARLVNSLECHE